MRLKQYIKNIGHWFNASLALLWYRYPSRHLTVIGVTGTDGKTTTATMLYHILKAANLKVALISTVAAYLGDERIDTGFHVTSPTPWALQKLIKKIADRGFTHLVVEATSHGLDQHRLLGVRVAIGIVTNITHEHLDYHRHYDRYLAAKAKLFRHAHFALLNQADASFEPLVKKLSSFKPRPHIQTYSGTAIPDYIRNFFVEPYNQLNAQAARTAAQLLSVEEATIKTGLASFEGVSGRMEAIKNTRGLHVYVDFAHTPNALEQVLTTLRSAHSGKLIAVYGCAGKRDYTKRPLMGEIGARLADYVILTSEDPRGENVESIIYQMKQGIVTGHDRVLSILDRTQALEWALHRLARTGDTVAILGKGHEQSMNLDGTHETPWSDQEQVRNILMSSRASREIPRV